MSKKEHIKYVYLIGAGGIGMSALGRYFLRQGALVYGYDKTPTRLTDTLQEEGMVLIFEDNAHLLPDFILKGEPSSETLIIYTPAIPKETSILTEVIKRGFKPIKRAEVLGKICQNHFTIAVSGTHGKTTTSSMIAHLLRSSGKDVTAFLGGICTNYNTNFLLGGPESVFVVEADEFDRSFLHLHPELAVVTSTSADHLDIYGEAEGVKGAYAQFASQVKEALFVHKGEEIADNEKQSIFSYAVDQSADFEGIKISIQQGIYQFIIRHKNEEIGPFRLSVPGLHNVENAIAAIAICRHIGISDEKLIKALSSYAGVKRRFEYVLRSSECTIIDDYAHHPEELNAAIATAKAIFPDKRITGVFQPHLYSRTRDFMQEFAQSLDQLHEIILLDIYPARELPIEGITSEALLKLCKNPNKQLSGKRELINRLQEMKPEVLLILGAGDIDALVEPIKNMLINQNA